MGTVVLVCTLFTLTVNTGESVRTTVKAVKAVHHHVLKPTAHGVKVGVVKTCNVVTKGVKQ